jgi:CBS domain-containing protein
MEPPFSTRGNPETDPLDVPVASLIQRPPVACGEDATIREVLARMKAEDVGSMVVCTGEGRPVGVFTLHDLLQEVAGSESDPGRPIASVVHERPVTLGPEAPAYEAGLAMTRHAIRHVVVLEGRRLVGVVSERDLFSLQQVALRSIAWKIRRADTVDDLRPAAAEIRGLAQHMIAQGTAADQITRFIATLDDMLTERLVGIELMATCSGRRVCWLAFGSAGRCEPTLAADQDNAIVFEPAAGETADAARAALHVAARRVNDSLAALGSAPGRGEWIAGDPRACLTSAEWRETFAGWLAQPDPQVLLRAAVCFDFRHVWGDVSLAEELREWIAVAAATRKPFVSLLARNALAQAPALDATREFVLAGGGDRPRTLDVKAGAVQPIVDCARVLALMAGVRTTGTVRRLRAAGILLAMDRNDVESFVRAFQFIQWVRLRFQSGAVDRGEPPGNHLDPDSIDELDRRILRESMRRGRRLQEHLAGMLGITLPTSGV